MRTLCEEAEKRTCFCVGMIPKRKNAMKKGRKTLQRRCRGGMRSTRQQ